MKTDPLPLTFYSATGAAASCGSWPQFTRLKRRGRFWTASGFPVGRHPWRLPSANPPCTSISSKNPKTLRVRHVCAFRASPLVSVRARPLFPLRARLISFVRGSSLSAGYHKRRSGDQRRLTRSHTPCLFRLSARFTWTFLTA